MGVWIQAVWNQSHAMCASFPALSLGSQKLGPAIYFGQNRLRRWHVLTACCLHESFKKSAVCFWVCIQTRQSIWGIGLHLIFAWNATWYIVLKLVIFCCYWRGVIFYFCEIGSPCADQAGHELRSACLCLPHTPVLGLKMFATTPGFHACTLKDSDLNLLKSETSGMFRLNFCKMLWKKMKFSSNTKFICYTVKICGSSLHGI